MRYKDDRNRRPDYFWEPATRNTRSQLEDATVEYIVETDLRTNNIRYVLDKPKPRRSVGLSQQNNRSNNQVCRIP